MSYTPHWHDGGETDSKQTPSQDISLLAVIAWIAAIVVTADCLFVAHRFLG